MQKKLCLFLFLLCWRTEGSFVFIGSTVTSPGEMYHLIVTSDKEQDVDINVLLEGEMSGEVDTVKIDTLEPGQKLIPFMIPESYVQNYTLKVSSEEFTETFRVNLAKRGRLFMVQTSKSSYHPGELLRYQIIPFKKMHFADGIEVSISDSYGMIVDRRRFADSAIKRSHEGSFSIPQNTPLGNWSIKTTTKLETSEIVEQTKDFRVLKTLSRDRIDINVRTVYSKSGRELEMEISAKYVSSQTYALGNISVSAVITDEQNSSDKWVMEARKYEIEANKVLKFSLEDDLKILPDRKAKIVFNLMFDENLTGMHKAIEYQQVACSNCFDISFVFPQKKFRPGLPFNFLTKTAAINAIKFAESKMQVDVTFSHSSGDFTKIALESIVVDGNAMFSINIPENAISIEITAKYFGESKTIQLKSSPFTTRETLKLTLDEISKEENKVTLKLNSTFELMEYYTIVRASGKSEVAFFNEDIGIWSDTFSLDLLPEFGESFVITVYAFHDGNFIHDALEVNLETPKNFITLSALPDRACPGETYVVTLNTVPGSIISLIAIDSQSLRKGDEDFLFANLKKSEIIEEGELTDFRTFALVCKTELCNRRSKRHATDEDGSGEITEFKEVDHVPETNDDNVWIFDVLVAENSDSDVTLSFPTGQLSANYIIAAASVHPDRGLAISDIQGIPIVQDFFIDIEMPSSTRYNEMTKIDVVVINLLRNLTKEVEAEIIYHRNDESASFEFVEKIPECKFLPNDSHQKTHLLTLKPQAAASTSFLLKPTGCGTIEFKISVQFLGLSYEVEKFLKVECYTRQRNSIQSIIQDSHSIEVDLLIPSDAIWENIQIWGSLTADILDHAFLNEEELLTKSTNLEEVLKVSMRIQSLMWLKYLIKINQTVLPNKKIENFFEEGYNKIMERRNSDGSFNYKGHGKYKSIQLTALVVRYLRYIGKNSEIERNYTEQALDFLQKHQIHGKQANLTGAFVELGVEDKGDFQLTALVLITFLEHAEGLTKYREVIDRGLEFLDRNYISYTTNYELSLHAYVMSLAKHESAQNSLNDLIRGATLENGMMFWDLPINSVEGHNNGNDDSKTIDIASNAILAVLRNEADVIDIYRIMLWLSKKKLESGNNFRSIVYVQALIEIVRSQPFPDTDMELSTTFLGSRSEKFEINNMNSRIAKKIEFPKNVRSIYTVANGTGLASFNIYYQYDTVFKEFEDKASISINLEKSSDERQLILNICVGSKLLGGEDDNDDIINEAVLEIEIPDGFRYDPNTRKFLKLTDIKVIKVHDDGRSIELEFAERSPNERIELCFDVRVSLNEKVEQRRRSVVRLYNSEKGLHAVEYYSTRGSQYCDFQ